MKISDSIELLQGATGAKEPSRAEPAHCDRVAEGSRELLREHGLTTRQKGV